MVCDDANMGVTHVIRGDDHLSNTPRQILIYEALGFDVPTFAHLSMILGPDGKKLSKRHARPAWRSSASAATCRRHGELPGAPGWSLDGETTLIDRKTLCERFSLDRVTKKDAVFDETKLDWMNGQYIKEMGANAWVQASKIWLAEARVVGKTGERAEPSAEVSETLRGEPVYSPLALPDDSVHRAALADIDVRTEWYARLYPCLPNARRA